MGTIAYKDGVIAFDDRRIDSDGCIINTKNSKVLVIGVNKKQEEILNIEDNSSSDTDRNVFIIGIDSENQLIEDQFIHWFFYSKDYNEYYELFTKSDLFKAIVIDVSKNQASYYSNTANNIVLTEEYAIGSGAKYALGAMWCGGKSAEEAVRAASKFDPFTGSSVSSYYINMYSNSISNAIN